ncbi:MAG: hypothetical protein L6R40_004737 [Gallowayella cf. fulva]|nr:MAG: hypothetical protein L6R40_004737 [Xanthomendoza cf. fulva]
MFVPESINRHGLVSGALPRASALRPCIAVVFVIFIFRSVYSSFDPVSLNWPEQAGFQAQRWLKKELKSHRQALQPIPKEIWQINFQHPRYTSLQESIHSWKKENPWYTHTVLNETSAKRFVRKHYSREPAILNTYLALGSPILRADYLRYLVLAVEGGVYTDLDTDAVKPIDDWLPGFPNDQVRALVGIEYDQLNESTIPEGLYLPLQFCQWSLAFSAHHPLMVSMVNAVTRTLQDLAISRGLGLEDLRPDSKDVLFTTGPVKWSQHVFAYLSLSTGTEVTYRNFTGLTEPRVMGDVAILPINSFATGLGFAGSETYTTEATLLRHRFEGAWRENGG